MENISRAKSLLACPFGISLSTPAMTLDIIKILFHGAGGTTKVSIYPVLYSSRFLGAGEIIYNERKAIRLSQDNMENMCTSRIAITPI